MPPLSNQCGKKRPSGCPGPGVRRLKAQRAAEMVPEEDRRLRGKGCPPLPGALALTVQASVCSVRPVLSRPVRGAAIFRGCRLQLCVAQSIQQWLVGQEPVCTPAPRLSRSAEPAPAGGGLLLSAQSRRKLPSRSRQASSAFAESSSQKGPLFLIPSRSRLAEPSAFLCSFKSCLH